MVRTAAILLLAILGHGLLMTSSADAGACPTRASPVAAVRPYLHCPAHDIDCFTIQGVVKSAPHALQLDGVAVSLSADLPSVIPAAWMALTPPGRPPDVARALLQVYRN
jgi:hypothetical protein